MKRAVIYIRVSTKQQAVRADSGEGYSLPTQRDACLSKAEALGASVVEEYVDKDTGTAVDKRPAMRRLLERIETETDIDFVIVHKLDRWARNTREDLVADFVLELAQCSLVSCSESIDRTAPGRLLHSMLASVNEYHSRNMSDEIRRKTLAKVQKGGTHGLAPLGYLNKQDGIDVRYVVVDPHRAPLIKWAFEAYATGDWTTRQLLGELTRRGLKSRGSRRAPEQPIHLSNLQHILTNPYYYGVVTHRGVQYAGSHEPLIDEGTWRRVQDMLAAKSNGEKQRTHHHYLKGTLFCGHCGSRLIVSHNKGRQGNTYPYFVCIGRHERRTVCNLKAQRIEVLEALVAQLYLHVRLGSKLLTMLRGTLAEELRTETELAEEERERQALRIQQLEAERASLMRAHYADAVPLDVLRSEQERLTEELASAKELLRRYELNARQVETTLDRAMDLLNDAHDSYARCLPADRKLMNQAFFRRLLVTEQGVVGWELAEPFESLLADELPQLLLTGNKNTPTSRAADLGERMKYQRQHPRLRHTGLVAGVKQGFLVETMGLEPTTSCLQSRCSSQLSYVPVVNPGYRPSGGLSSGR
jgi:site-specific DNA recombinase